MILLIVCVLLSGCSASHTDTGVLRGDILFLRLPIQHGKQESITIAPNRIAARSFDPVGAGTRINQATVPDPLWSDLENLRHSWCAQAPAVSRVPDNTAFEIVFECHKLSGFNNPVSVDHRC
jgi:hypothetical protein